MIVTRMTHYASLLCFELIGTIKLMLVCLYFKVFLFSGPKPFKFQDLFYTMKFSMFRCAQERQLYYCIHPPALCQQFFSTKKQKFSKFFCLLFFYYIESSSLSFSSNSRSCFLNCASITNSFSAAISSSIFLILL